MRGSQRERAESLRRKAMRKAMALRSERMSDNELAEHLAHGRDQLLASNEWRAIRQKMIERHGAKCMKCGYVPREVSSINVDHIKPRKFYPELAMDEDNLQLLCWRCNKAKGNTVADYRHPAAALPDYAQGISANDSSRRAA